MRPCCFRQYYQSSHSPSSSFSRHHDASSGVELSHSDVEFVDINFDYGQKVNDPIAKVPFYRKDGSIMRTSMREISLTLPGDSNIAEQKIFVYATTKEVVGPVR